MIDNGSHAGFGSRVQLNKRRLFKEDFLSGVLEGRDGFICMMKFLVPFSLFTVGLEWSGGIRHFAHGTAHHKTAFPPTPDSLPQQRARGFKLFHTP